MSGVMNLPMLIGLGLTTILAGGVVSTTGQYMPLMFFGAIAATIGSGLISTLKADSGHPQWIGYQALYGIGAGAGLTQPMIAVQAAVTPTDAPSVTVIVVFMQTLGGAIFVSVAQNMFHNKLLSLLESLREEDGIQIDVSKVMAAGATTLRSIVSDDVLPKVLRAYSDAITYSFYIAVALSGVAILGALPMQWLSLKKKA